MASTENSSIKHNRFRYCCFLFGYGLLLSLILELIMAKTALADTPLPAHIEAGKFSSSSQDATLPNNWQPLTFNSIKRHTQYSLVKENNITVVKAVSNQSASGLTRPLAIDPNEYPVIQWRWKINNVLKKGDVRRKDGDDYPARVYITFSFNPEQASFLERAQYRAAQLLKGEDVPYRAISYIWGSNSKPGTLVANAYTDQAMMFVVQSGSEKVHQWITEERNVYDDYRSAFGEEPTMITGVAIMTDTDNTRESTIAWYGDIIFREALLTPTDPRRPKTSVNR